MNAVTQRALLRLPPLRMSTGPRDSLYVTTPIYYVNAAPHVGHAYTSVAADAAARFARLDGTPCTFLATGTDEHGEKVEESARAQGVEPLEFATSVSTTFRQLADAYDVSYDAFVRTTDAAHKKTVEDIWSKLVAAGDIYLGAYEGWYCVRDECYYAESDLVDGKAPTGAEVEWREKEPSYFFRLSKYQDALLELYGAADDESESESSWSLAKGQRTTIAPMSRRNEVVSFLKTETLRDLSVSRTTFTWGVPVPGDADHVVYVWIDALCNYLTAIGYPDHKEWQERWRGATHVVGKDILRFHAVYWPAMCLSAGIPVPEAIVAHGWWTKDGEKISKSLGNVVDPFDLLDTYGLDATRYFLLADVPFGADGDFSQRAVLAAANGYLANAVGNFAQRVCTMLTKAPCAGVAPEVEGSLAEILAKHAPDSPPDLLETARTLPDRMRPHLYTSSNDDGSTTTTTTTNLRFDLALREIEAVVREANRYFDSAKPWTLKKTDPAAMTDVLAVALELLRCVAIAYQPFMPRAAERMLDQIGVPPDERSFADLAARECLEPGTPLQKPTPIFPKIESVGEDGDAGASAPPPPPPPKKQKVAAAAASK